MSLRTQILAPRSRLIAVALALALAAAFLVARQFNIIPRVGGEGANGSKKGSSRGELRLDAAAENAAAAGGRTATDPSAASGGSSANSTQKDGQNAAASPGREKGSASSAQSGPAPGTGAPGSASSPAQDRFIAPRQGNYRYQRNVDKDGKRTEEQTMLAVKNNPSTAGSTLQRHSRQGPYQTFYSDLLWRAKTLKLTKGTFPEEPWGEKQFECDWAPALTVFPDLSAKGASWSEGGACAAQGNAGITGTYHGGNAAITDVTHIEVGGRPVAAWVVERHRTAQIVMPGSVPINVAAKFDIQEWFLPESGLVAKQAITSEYQYTAPGTNTTRRSLSQMDLLSLDPA